MPTIKVSKRIEQQNILLTFIILIRINKITLRMKLSQMGLQLRPEALKGAGRNAERSDPQLSIREYPDEAQARRRSTTTAAMEEALRAIKAGVRVWVIGMGFVDVAAAVGESASLKGEG